MRFMLMIIAAATAFAPPAIAQTATGAAAPAPKKEKKICRSEVALGSMFRKHICDTKAEWDQLDKDNARDIDQFNHRRSGVGGGMRDEPQK